MNPTPVLGMFKSEDELRDHLAANLGLIEPGLTLITTNYPVTTLLGANGVLDILAKDTYGCFVIIEVKRSDQAARQALHELSKYISAFMTTQHVDEQKLRCFVVSTHWHELDTPLAFFRATATVNVKGFHVSAEQGSVKVHERTLLPVDSLPKLCPDTRLLQTKKGAMLSVVDDLRKASALIPGIRAALLQFEPVSGHDDLAVLCMWRIGDDAIDSVNKTLGTDDVDEGDDIEPPSHRYESWSEEASVLDWLTSQCKEVKVEFATMRMGTPEKILAILETRRFKELFPIGAWPKNDLVHDLAEMERCVVAQDLGPSAPRTNRYFFKAKSSPRVGPSWAYTIRAFAAFVEFESFWRSEVERFLSQLEGTPDVTFFGQDIRHFHFRIHQHLEHSAAQLSQFSISVSDANGRSIRQLLGGWAWDGKTCPIDEVAQLKSTYGSIDQSRMAVISSSDVRRYEFAYRAHGFNPWVIELDKVNNTGELITSYPGPRNIDVECGINVFVDKNRAYCERISKVYAAFPTGPGGGRTPLLFELTGE
ncbi:DUF91 domain-containing protein [Rhodoferax sp. 4810]|nr:DUF91 domain-containing protein [Rhodoferax jenense]